MITLPPSPGIHLSLSLSKLHPLKINQTQFSASTPTYISIILKLKKILTKPCECVWPPGGRLQSSCRATNISASLCLEEIQNTCVYSCNRLSNRCFFLNIWSQCMYFHQWCSPALWKTCDFWGIRQIDRIPWWSWASACSNPSQPLLLLGLLALIREQEDDGDCGDAVGDGGVQPPQLILHHELMGLLSQQCWLIKNK